MDVCIILFSGGIKMDNRPIGFMDSGVGGLTVVKTAQKLLPNEEIIFIGDEARMPYGPRPTAEVVEFSRQMASFLITKNIKALVIACNTATNAALAVLQAELPIPVIGVILPGAIAANRQTKNQKIGVIATLGTIKSEAYPKALAEINTKLRAYPVACQEFVEIAEKNELHTTAAQKVMNEKLAEFRQDQIDTLILGCTHFPLLEEGIQAAVGPDVTLVDPGVETVHQLIEILTKQALQHVEGPKAQDQYYSTGNIKNFEEIARTFLNQDLRVEEVKID